MKDFIPHYTRAKVLAAEEWRGVGIELLGNVEGSGLTRYRFLLVARGLPGMPTFWVSSERSRLLRSGASHGFFLGLFRDGRHANLGQSRDWSDQRLFLLKAMMLLREAAGRPLAVWPLIPMEKDALMQLWAESGAAGLANPAREYLRHYDVGLPPMMSRRTDAG